MGAERFADYLLERVGVAALHGSDFGFYAENHLRMCFGTSVENLEKAIHRIGEAIAQLN
jgi:aspartate/methionine/tyrosine aminotransferase